MVLDLYDLMAQEQFPHGWFLLVFERFALDTVPHGLERLAPASPLELEHYLHPPRLSPKRSGLA
jgi:hypothetical protein